MSKYVKDGVVYNKIQSVVINGIRYINPKEDQILAAGYSIYVPSAEELLAEAISAKVSDLEEYADSYDMNTYIAKGVAIRLPVELRLRLRNVIDSKIALGETELTEYYEGHSYTYPLTAWDVQLTQYENYEYEVMCTAEQHKLNIQALTSIDEVEAYDYTTGYPEKLVFA